MSIIFGLTSKPGCDLDVSWTKSMKNDLMHVNPDLADSWGNSRAAMGNLSIFNTPESLHEILPYHDSESGLVISSDSRIDNRYDLAKRLNIHDNELKTLPDSSIILKAFQKYHTSCTSFLKGDFSFAIYDVSNQRLFIARDHFGMKPLFYTDHPDAFAFSSELRGILALPFFKQTVNEEWLLDFLINATRNEYDTFYQGIHVLPPGHQILVEHGLVTLHRYWNLTVPERIFLKNDQEYIEAYKALFETSVKNRIRSAYPVGAELSGGLDSSSISAVAQKFLLADNKNLHVFARALPEIRLPNLDDPTDESSEVSLVCEFCGISNLHWVTMENQKITQNIAQIIDTGKTPYLSNYAAYNLNTHHHSGSAGVRTILSGHGGDQMVSNYGQFVYKDYLRQHRYLKFWKEIRAKDTPRERNLSDAFRYFLNQISKSGKQSDKQYRGKKLYRFGIDKSFIINHQLTERYLEARAQEVLVPSGLSDLIRKITHRHMNDRIEVTNLMAAPEKTEYRYPLFDVDLINYYLAMPDEMKHKFRSGRYIHRMALEGMLPEKIQWRTDKHGTINPGLARIFANDADTIKAEFAAYQANNPDRNSLPFDPEMITRLLSDEDEHMIDYKGLINKFIQLKTFTKIIDPKVA